MDDNGNEASSWSGIITETHHDTFSVLASSDTVAPRRSPTFNDRRGHEERERRDGCAIFARTLRSHPSSLSAVALLLREGAKPVAPRQVTARNTTVRCGHLSLSRVASRNKTFLQERSSRRRMRMRTRRPRVGKRRGGLAVGCRGCSRIDYLPALHRIGVCSRPVLPSLFARHIPARPPLLYLSLRTYSVFPSPRPIYLPPRVAEWILFVSHRYFSRPACRSPSKTVSPPRFMFPPTQRRIDPFLLSDVYVCGGASFTLPFQPPPFPLPERSRASTDLPHTTDYTRSRSRRPPRSPRFAFFRDFFSAVLSPSPALFALFFLWRHFIDSWLPYRVREIYARALLDGRLSITTSQRPEAFTSTTVMDK